jgi:hypothetical protein
MRQGGMMQIAETLRNRKNFSIVLWIKHIYHSTIFQPDFEITI